MKKQYITPLCETIKSEAKTIMAGSPPGIGDGPSNPNEETLAKRYSSLEDDFGEE